MDLLKKFFPLSFNVNDVAALIIRIIAYLVAGVIVGFVISLLFFIPVINLLTGLIGALAEIYIIAGLVIAFLDFFKVLK